MSNTITKNEAVRQIKKLEKKIIEMMNVILSYRCKMNNLKYQYNIK